MEMTTAPAIRISDQAAERIRQIRTDMNVPEGAPLRVSVRSGGCSGLTYDLDFEASEKLDEKDQQFSDNGIDVVIDMRSFLYLAGTELDYSEGLEGKGFHFRNPNAARTCSCGESFSL